MQEPEGSNVLAKLLSEYAGYIWLLGMAIWGGTSSYISRIKKAHMRFSLPELIGEWSISSFSGFVTALLCSQAGMSFELCAAMAGIGGHMGGRAIFVIEKYVVNKFGVGMGTNNKKDD